LSVDGHAAQPIPAVSLHVLLTAQHPAEAVLGKKLKPDLHVSHLLLI